MPPTDASAANLAASQEAFAQALHNPRLPAPCDIRRHKTAAQSKRFNVYRNNVTVALIEALQAAYPAIRKLVGDDFFNAAARIYAEDKPPRTPLMFRFGADFANFLEAFPPAQSVPYLADVARLERMRLDAFHAADARSLDIAILSDIAPDRLGQIIFEFHPSRALLRSRYPAVSLWSASTGAEPRTDIDLTRGEDALTVRPELDVDTRILPSGAYPFIHALMSGKTLEEAADVAQGADRQFNLSFHLAGLFETSAITGAQLRPI